jgi:hypothetical protein
MTGHAKASAWVARYVRAWNSNDPSDIGDLFTPGALYSTGPFDRPWRGRATIVRRWLARQDVPGTTTFRHEVLAAERGTYVVRGWTKYRRPAREYSNVWLLRLDGRGRCREFREWWVERGR